ncbi:MAG TPA: DUF4097 family beta strand repeat-containing protein [Bacteroidales bacterium]|jgi:hypothetical protein|nr:MAG: hypothetical protein BWX96_01610 [Bacteroidetes bacterium ADurb.Bin145]HOU01922.1 DUF4097 family beta strand repeat-containing protein [Bacteroidales bacterium]HQG62583.1 DUF4097 family beta strand repeat-containing protein [Bacteroidales bacterium]HQK67304.1 DUF4097 family beta strand repeat-containing protein [Bacteroidales bacterium]
MDNIEDHIRKNGEEPEKCTPLPEICKRISKDLHKKRGVLTRWLSAATIILICLFSFEILSGQSFEEKKKYSKTFPVKREMTLELNNKYGNIHISSWQKDSVYVVAEVEATSSSLKRLHNMFDGVDVDISGTDYLVRVKTEFSQDINDLVETIKGLTDKLIPYESRIRINYKINAPEYIDMRITDKYGDVYIENCRGQFTLNLANGSFKANEIDHSKSLQLTFCDATINSLAEGDIESSFSELTIGESRDLDISSVSSRLDLKKAGNIYVESRRDKFYVGSVNSITGNSYFTDFRIDNLGQELNLETRYGNLSAEKIESSFKGININSNYTDIDLTFGRSLSYNLDIRHTNSNVTVPEKNSDLDKRKIDENRNEAAISGTVGRNPGNVKVIIKAVRGNIYIK